jgi:hypothetical protein
VDRKDAVGAALDMADRSVKGKETVTKDPGRIANGIPP